MTTTNALYEVRDTQRILDIMTKSHGDPSKALQLAQTMARSITDAAKALRRCRAAEDQNQHDMSVVFYGRYLALIGIAKEPAPWSTYDKTTQRAAASKGGPTRIRKPQLKTLTIAKLIKVLQNEDPTALAIFSTDYGDHHHTDQALAIEGTVEEKTIVKSAYSQSGWALADEGDSEEEDPTYLVIR